MAINRTEDNAVDIEIIDEPIRFHLYGKSATVNNQCYGDVGMCLTNEMWNVVKDATLETTGINHWVYLSDGRMFVGVEVKNSERSTIPEQLEPLEFQLQRYLKHIHIGPYQALPQKWRALRSEFAALGETIALSSLEIYGHSCEDESEAETTILMGLNPKLV